VLVLGFDTSTPAVTVALVDLDPDGDADTTVDTLTGARLTALPGDGLVTLAERTEVAANRHGELLAPLIEQVLRTAHVAPAQLGAVAVGLGPGPFTGLRVGVVTAKAMGDALGVPVYGESSLRVMAALPTGPRSGGVAIDARRKQVYWAAYEGAECVAGPDLSLPEVAAEHLLAADVRRVFGEGPFLYPEQFAAFTSFDDAKYPRASSLVALVRDRAVAGQRTDDLTPLYLRRPDAQPPGRPKPVTPA
jgi:tRNA threonylcarbamoyl adenosine modification protein YeaZ